MEGIPHHLIDIIEPAEEYNVQIFQESAKKIIDDIHKRNKVPILAGGTGLYIDSLVYDYSFLNESADNSIRNKLWDEFHKHGSSHIIAKLKEKDPDSLSPVDLSNTKELSGLWK
jgi:tRNA dimethylallyltransferase